MLISEVAILVVDDVNSVRAQVKILLKEVGFQNITLAESGQHALKLLNEQEFNLVLSDWQMEPLNGMELLKQVRQHPKYEKLPFIMVTAENAKEKIVQAIQSGVDDYLMKPLTPVQIQTKVVGLLLKRQLL